MERASEKTKSGGERMKRRAAKRMHSEDARFLRDLLVHLIERINEVEAAVGSLQQAQGDGITAEVIEA